MTYKTGFVLNFAFCRNCAFHIEYDIKRQMSYDKNVRVLPDVFTLKEQLREFIEQKHDTLKWCEKRRIVLSYTLALYEE